MNISDDVVFFIFVVDGLLVFEGEFAENAVVPVHFGLEKPFLNYSHYYYI